MIADRIESGKNYLSVGNQNSYGDASIPKGKYILNHYESKNVSTSVFDYQTDNMLLLFGVPGKSNVTIGGAIAADTHGKDNHWGGSFSKNVKKIKLATKKGCIVADRENNFDVFQTTVGGYGLTGSIVDVELYENNLQITNIYDTEITTGIVRNRRYGMVRPPPAALTAALPVMTWPPSGRLPAALWPLPPASPRARGTGLGALLCGPFFNSMYRVENGSILVPEVLRNYMGGVEKIEANV